MRYKNYIFDLYGTLIDIHTDENQQALWDFMSKYLEDNFGTTVTSEVLRRDYRIICTEEEQKLAEQNGSKHPEIKIENVWQRLIGKDVTIEEMRKLCNTFREKSRDKLVRYDGVAELLNRIKADGGKIYLLSNAQRLFTEKELEDTDLVKYFDDIFISSDFSGRNPFNSLEIVPSIEELYSSSLFESSSSFKSPYFKINFASFFLENLTFTVTEIAN